MFDIEVEGNWLLNSVKGNASLYGIKLHLMDSTIFNKQCYFWQKMSFLITENEIVTLANERTMSIDNKNQFYVGIILSISIIENIVIENFSFVENNTANQKHL